MCGSAALPCVDVLVDVSVGSQPVYWTGRHSLQTNLRILSSPLAFFQLAQEFADLRDDAFRPCGPLYRPSRPSAEDEAGVVPRRPLRRGWRHLETGLSDGALRWMIDEATKRAERG
jgi:hypothetical protein